MIGIVYSYRNIENNKTYIGKTINEKQRKIRHIRNSKTVNTPFYAAIRKYGWDKFEYQILYKIEHIDKNFLDSNIKEKEKEFIIKYDTVNNGYNLTYGGDGSCGLYPSIETRNKMSNQRKGSLHPMFGKKSSMRKPVLKLDSDGTILEEYQSIKEAAIKNNAKTQHVSRCCHGKRNKTRGYKYVFK